MVGDVTNMLLKYFCIINRYDLKHTHGGLSWTLRRLERALVPPHRGGQVRFLNDCLGFSPRQVLKIFHTRQLAQILQAELQQELFRCAVHHRAPNRFLASLRHNQLFVQ